MVLFLTLGTAEFVDSLADWKVELKENCDDTGGKTRCGELV